MAWIGDVVPYERRQAVLARFMIGLILGNGVGVLIGGFCADYLDWRIPFWLIALAFLLTGAYLTHLRRKLPAQALAKSGLHGESSLPLWKAFSLVVSVPWARVILTSVFIEGALVFGTLAFIPTILHLRLGMSLTAAGSVVMLFGLGGLCFAVFSPVLVRRLGEVWLIRGGAIVMAMSMLTIGYSPSWWLILPACFLFGLGFYMMHNTLQINATQMVPERRGAAVAAFASCFFFGQAIGVAMTGVVLDKTSGTHLSIFLSLAVLLVGLQLAKACARR
jgi:predicted MFS family arabinose efflux permease